MEIWVDIFYIQTRVRFSILCGGSPFLPERKTDEKEKIPVDKQFIDSYFYFLIHQRLAVEIMISGFVFDKEDFIRPWEIQNDNLERYKLFYHFP